jgi:hypothetical protein
LKAQESFIALPELQMAVHQLIDAAKQCNTNLALAQLQQLVPEFKHNK